MPAEFRWNEWNLEHVALHGVTIDEAEMVVAETTPPYPEYIGDGKYRVYGRGTGGRLIHVIFIWMTTALYTSFTLAP